MYYKTKRYESLKLNVWSMSGNTIEMKKLRLQSKSSYPIKAHSEIYRRDYKILGIG